MPCNFKKEYEKLPAGVQENVLNKFHRILMWRGHEEAQRHTAWDHLVLSVVRELEDNGLEIMEYN